MTLSAPISAIPWIKEPLQGSNGLVGKGSIESKILLVCMLSVDQLLLDTRGSLALSDQRLLLPQFSQSHLPLRGSGRHPQTQSMWTIPPDIRSLTCFLHRASSLFYRSVT